jgi:hypothetical protein
MGNVKHGNLTGVHRQFQVGKGAHPADAMLAINSTTKGLLPPRMTTAQREAIVSPTAGLTVFDETIQRLFVYADGAWRRIEAESIDAPLTMYVDGSAGDDDNDGLSWGTAKQTFGFLMAGEPDAIPRCINAAVVVQVRNDVRARSSAGHLVINGFYGVGSLTVNGEMTSVETFTATAYQNEETVRGSRQWVADPTKVWTPNQWRRHFVDLGHTYRYPIRENNATTLWMGFGDDQSGAYAATIYSVPEVLRELVTDPGVKYDFAFDSFVNISECSIVVNLTGLWIDENAGLQLRFMTSHKIYLQYIAMTGMSLDYTKLIDLSQCYVNLLNYDLIAVNKCQVIIGNCAIDSTDGLGYGVYPLEGAEFTMIESWIGNQLFAFDVMPGAVLVFNRDNYIQDTDVAVLLEGGQVLFQTPIAPPLQLRFDTVRQAIVGMGDITRQAEFEIRGWDVDHEFVFSDADIGSFADFTAATLKSRQQLRLTYSDAAYVPILQREYDNTNSGLTAVRYQTAIDELAELVIKEDATFYGKVSALPMAAGILATPASAVTVTPSGGIASTNVQLALEELDAEKATPADIPAFEASTANILMDGTVSVGDTVTVPRANHRHPVDTSRLAAVRGNWKAFHSDGSGVFSEIALGAAGTVLKGNGVAAAPSFGAVGAVFPVFNVKDYGAVGNGVADDTTAIRDTLTAAAASGERGSTIFFPGGIYKTTGTITVNDTALTFRGPGMGAALINPTSTNIPVFQLTAGNEFITFRDLEIGTITAQVAGSSFIDTNGAHNVLIDRVNMFGWFYGIYIRGASGKVTVSNVQLKDGVATTGVGIYIDNSTATDVNLGPWVMVTNATGAKPLAGVLVKACGGFSLNNVTVNNTTHGLQLYPSSGADVQYGRVADCVFDLAGTNGAYVYTPNQASPGRVRSIKFIGCLFSSANAAGVGHGVTLEGASNGVMDAVSFDSCRIFGNGRHGINYLFGSNIRVNGSTIAGNSASASNTYDGIAIAANISDFEILQNRIGQSGPAANTQRYAINIAAGASDRYQIVGNDVGLNNTAPYILDGGTGVFKRILQNGNAMPISHMPALTTAMQSLAVAANVLTGSLISLPVNSLLVGTRFCWEIVLIKTAAGTATWAVQVKFGTAGTTADALIASWTSGTNTAAIDQARLRIVCDILTLGASATARCNAFYVNTLTNATGLGRIAGAPTSTATFNSASSPAFIHIGVTPGASAVMTSMCEAQIIGAG